MSERSKRAQTDTAAQNDTVQSFIEALRTDSSGNHILHGMVKPADTTDGLMFALPDRCDHWIYLPATSIQSIRHTGRIACKGHFHTSAEIRLKAPQTDIEKTFADVASLHQASLLELHRNLPSAAVPNPSCPPGTSWRQDQWGNWGCWP